MIRRRPFHGFSLIELLVVIAIMAILIAVGASSLGRGGSNLGLTTTVAHLQGALDEARQTALANNKYVQVRFLAKPGGKNYEAISVLVAESPFYGSSAEYDAWQAQGLIRQGGRPLILPQNLVIPRGAEASQLLSDLASDTDFQRTGTNKVGGQTYEWVAFYFRPNGITDYQMLNGTPYSGTNAFFSLVAEPEYAQSTPHLPKNFATFILSPASGRPVIFRP